MRSAELERLAANGEKAMAERDELKDECRELTSSNSRMGEKIAELVSKNGGNSMRRRVLGACERVLVDACAHVSVCACMRAWHPLCTSRAGAADQHVARCRDARRSGYGAP